MWSTAFLSKLGQISVTPSIVVQTVKGPGSIGRGAWVVSNDPRVGQTAQLGGLSPIMGSTVNPVDWTANPGGFSVSLIGDTSTIRKNLWRGQLVQVSVGSPSQPPDTFEAVALGQVWGVSGTVTGITIECRDMLGILGSRFTATAGEYALFHDAFSATTVDGSHAAGATTYTVASTTGFTKQNDGSGTLKGLLQITPAGGTPFYKTYTGKNATQFTGVTAAGVLGTTAAATTTADVVTEIPYADDHPIDFVRKVLVSTGADTNGSYDWYPAGWGFGFSDWMIDHHDCDRYKQVSSPATGSADWDFYSLTTQANPYQWLQQQIQPGGFFLAMRQGRITVRCAQYLTDVGTSTAALFNGVWNATGLDISDADIDAGAWPEWEGWDSGYPVEFNRLRVKTYSGTLDASETVNSLPADYTYTVPLGDRIFDNESAHRSVISVRLKPWTLRIPERLAISYRGLRLAPLAAGDAVPLNIMSAGGRLDTTADGYVNRWAMVLRNDVDWMGGRGRVSVAIAPDKADDWG